MILPPLVFPAYRDPLASQADWENDNNTALNPFDNLENLANTDITNAFVSCI
jgi:hypothetical protein